MTRTVCFYMLVATLNLVIVPSSMAAPALLSVKPSSLTLQAYAGNNVASQSVAISNDGTAALKWQVGTPTATWLSVSPTSGTNSGTLTVAFRTSALAVGNYVGSFTVTANTGAPVTVNVKVSILTKTTTTQTTPTTGYGPSSTITCPAGAVDIWPGQNIQAILNNFAGATTFCLRSGVHSIKSPIVPKTYNVFVGQYGAILDGTGWATTDTTQAAFRAHNQDIDNVTIRNLVIRNMPQRGIHAYGYCQRWTIEFNEIAYNRWGVHASDNFVFRNNYIHHNVGPDPNSTDYTQRGGAYAGYRVTGVVFEGNQIAYNGPEQKMVGTNGVVFRRNWVHHNHRDGIWFDADNVNVLIEDNVVENNGRTGILYEINGSGVFRNNTSSRNVQHGIMVTTSKNLQIYGNRLEDNQRSAIYLWLDSKVGTGTQQVDLLNVRAYSNTIRVPNVTGATGAAFNYCCVTAAFAAPYVGGQKNLTFDHNTYRVPTLTGWFGYWPALYRTWSEWLALGQDVGSTISLP